MQLLPGNREAYLLWQHLSTQWRGGGMGIIGLDYGEARRMARDVGVGWSYGILKKLQRLEAFELARAHDPGDSGDQEC